MKKTISITIGKIVFNLEEAAYYNLQEYLNNLGEHFKNVSYGQEVVSDIENRIAEQFSVITSGQQNHALTNTDVQNVLQSIGAIEDFDNENQTEITNKKLYRNSQDATIAGVASGVASYFGWDTTVVRILFVISALFWGWGLALYLILWIVMPEAKTASQKMAMRGMSATIRNFEKSAKAKFEKIKLAKSDRDFFETLGKIIKGVFDFLTRLIGIVMVLVSAFFITLSTFLAVNLIFNRKLPYVDPVFSNIFSGLNYYLLISLAFIAIIIPFVYLIVGGLSILKRRSVISFLAACILAGIWLISASGASVLFFQKFSQTQSVITSYQGQTETRPIENIDLTKINQIRATGHAVVNITYAQDYSMEVKGYTYQLDNLKVASLDKTLLIENIEPKNKCFICLARLLIKPSIIIDIKTPNLTAIEGSGAVRFNLENFKNDDFALTLNDASRADLNIETKNIVLSLKDATQASLVGSGQTLTANLSGASKLKAFEFETNKVQIKTSDAANAEINTSEQLEARASDASKIIYQGNPSLEQTKSQAAQIQKASALSPVPEEYSR